MERIHPDGVETIAIQGQGSALILVPELLGPILGKEPRLLLAPVRNTLVALPDDVDPDLAFRLWDAIAEGCHDELDLNLLHWTGTTVVADGDEASGPRTEAVEAQPSAPCSSVAWVAQPTPPRLVIRSTGGDEGPERRAVAEHAQMRELVDHDRLEAFARGEHQSPRQ